MNTRPLIAAATAATLTLIGAAAEAKVLAFATRASNFSFTSATALVPLDASGTTTLTVTNPKAKAVNYVLTYSAECAAIGGSTNAWLDLDVMVNGSAVAPTSGSADAFCASNGGASYGNWLRPSITLVVPLLPGANSIQIQGRLDNGATGGWLGDSSLVVTD